MLLDRVQRHWFARFAGYAYGARGCVKSCLSIVLVVSLGAISTLAYLSTPDSVGLPGIYDDADHDDVVGLLIDSAGLENSRLTSVDPLPLLLWTASCRNTPAPRDGSLLSFHLRSPPIA